MKVFFSINTCGYLIETAKLFIYQDNNDIKVIMSDELLKIIDERMNEVFKNINFKEKNYVDNESDYVYEYMTANGIIEREKLKELLYTHHEIDISLDELNKLVLKEKCIIKDNLYLLFNYDKEEIEFLKNLKEMKSDYRVCSYSNILPENHLIEELNGFLEIKSIENKDDVVGLILSGIKYGLYNEDGFKEELKDNNIKLNSNIFKELCSIIKNIKTI